MALEEPQLHCHAHSDTRHTNIHGIGKTPFPLPYPVLHYPSTVNCCFALYFHCWQAYTVEYPLCVAIIFQAQVMQASCSWYQATYHFFKYADLLYPHIHYVGSWYLLQYFLLHPKVPRSYIPILTCSSDIHTGLWFYGLGL